ncbi:N-acetylglucosamine-1-phosphate uridyltransferase / Glucosamine-1-phosphate N-acetyltransferase [hydrothermal vent metagenome]|uniref:N-acetylglucosamine-1-phosphate uridyltransferase / Glucosamine-1-phosphate N-acetyltransferase n=1 Tax=hydrothermal vent metagenome TaxID=652676 RepID=A0A3B0ZWQ5_9ZZZZ
MTEQAQVSVIILAAGQGTRMKSKMPKVLHPIGGKPLLAHVINTAKDLHAQQTVVVYGHGGELVKDTLSDEPVTWVEQKEQLGTGHAVDQATPKINDDHIILVLYGDVPLIKASTLSELISKTAGNALAILTVVLDEPQGYGRIVRDTSGAIQRIVEQKDASEGELTINEINTGILAVQGKLLKSWLSKLENNNAQGEYYLTDIIAMAVADGVTVNAAQPAGEDEVLGVNSRSQLAYLERSYQRDQAELLMAQGVTVIDPSRLEVRGAVKTGKDVTLDVNVVLEGHVEIADDVYIGPNCIIRDSVIGAGVQIQAMCVIDNAMVGEKCLIGPYSRLRPGAELKGGNHIGNFVEVKNSVIGQGSKVNHLTYIGDTDMGAGVNIGAGTITANYDGANKHRTAIGDNASTGSNSVLVAPVCLGEKATLGAGTVLTKDAPNGKLTVARTRQITIDGWHRPVKKK